MKRRQYAAIQLLHSALVANAPKDTWNLALNGIRIAQDAGQWYILIGGEIAPYAESTNEEWGHGRNPNQGWIEKTIESCLPMISSIMSGSISKAELEEYQKERWHKKLISDYQEHIELKVKELAAIENL